MEAYVYDHVRTPRGKGRPDGALHEVTSVEMATQLLKASIMTLESYPQHRDRT